MRHASKGNFSRPAKLNTQRTRCQSPEREFPSWKRCTSRTRLRWQMETVHTQQRCWGSVYELCATRSGNTDCLQGDTHDTHHALRFDAGKLPEADYEPRDRKSTRLNSS